MTARIIDADTGHVVELSDGDWFTAIFGRPPRTKAGREADWRADCERYADMIENGAEWGVPPPYLYDARKIVEERAMLTEVHGDPLWRAA